MVFPYKSGSGVAAGFPDPAERSPRITVPMGDSEHVIAQSFDTTFSLSWTTDQSAAEVMAPYLVGGDGLLDATVGFKGESQMQSVDGSELLDLLDAKGDRTEYVKLRRSATNEHVRFNASHERNEASVSGPPLINPDDSARLVRLYEAMSTSASPTVRENVAAALELVFPYLIYISPHTT